MISDQLRSEVRDWIISDPDKKTAAQLQNWLDENNEIELKRCFNGFLQFGTAGLRGPIGPGPSCMNRAVVSRTATGIAAFMNSHNLTSVVIGRDARHGSAEFALDSAEIFAGAGIKTFVLPRELPTPVLAFAVKKLSASLGIMVTASHNPASDNGVKYDDALIGIPWLLNPKNISKRDNSNAYIDRNFKGIKIFPRIIKPYISNIASIFTKNPKRL